MNERPQLGTVTVGQTVIVHIYRSMGYRDIRAVVTNVARVWITVEPAEGEPSLAHYEVRFRIGTQDTGSGSAYRTSFRTEAQYAWDQEQRVAKDLLKTAQIDVDPGYRSGPWASGDRLLALAAFVTEYDKNHTEEV